MQSSLKSTKTSKHRPCVCYWCGRRGGLSLFSTGILKKEKKGANVENIEKQKCFHLPCIMETDGDLGSTVHSDLSFFESLLYAIYFFILQFIDVHAMIVIERINTSLVLLLMYSFMLPLIPLPILIISALIVLTGHWKSLLLHRRYLAQLLLLTLYIHFCSDLGSYFTPSGAPLDVFSLACAYLSIWLRVFFFLRGCDVVAALDLTDEHEFRKIAGRLLLAGGDVPPDLFMVSCLLFGTVFYYVSAPSYYALENVIAGMGVASSLWVLKPVKYLPVGFKVNFILF